MGGKSIFGYMKGAAVSLLCLGFVPDLIRQIGYDLTSFMFAPNNFKNCTPGYFSFYSMHYCSCSDILDIPKLEIH
jgi:hypothetical protein